MTTPASLKAHTLKDLARMAKEYGVPGWHSMRKDQLVRALVRVSKSKKKPSRKSTAATSKKKSTPARRATTAAGAAKHGRTSAKAGKSKKTAKLVQKRPKATPKPKNARVVRRIKKVNSERERQKDLSAPLATAAQRRNGEVRAKQKQRPANGSPSAKTGLVEKDRIVLLVRDPFWLQACWDVTRHSVQRARAAMAEHWHTAKPILRVLEVESGSTTSTAERVSRDIEIHGGVKNWYIDVPDPPKSFRVDLGYLAPNGKFYSLARSNTVTTPSPGSSDAIDENWTDVAANYEKIYALSGGYSEDNAGGDLQELFEERLRRPMGSPLVTRFGMGAERMLKRDRDFVFEVDAELIIFGLTKPDAHVTLAGEPVRLRPDGTFTVRLSLPDRRQVLPVVASSSDGVEQRTTVLAVERNTKVMEPMIRESAE